MEVKLKRLKQQGWIKLSAIALSIGEKAYL
jgi:hypothetical protein